jgi:hypothetical protein
VHWRSPLTVSPAFAGHNVEQVWEQIQVKKQGYGESSPQPDLKIPEWEVLNQKGSVPVTKDFKISRVAPPQGSEAVFEETVLLERVREVRALLAFTRIESKGDFAQALTGCLQSIAVMVFGLCRFIDEHAPGLGATGH